MRSRSWKLGGLCGLLFFVPVMVIAACSDDEENPSGPGADAATGQQDSPSSNQDGNAPPNDSGSTTPDGGTDADVCIGVDVDASADHCGRCGHSCLGGQCQAGVCQPTTVATAQGRVGGLVVDATHIYWTSLTNNQVVRAPKAGGGTAQVLASAPAVGAARSLAVSGAHVYWGNDDFTNTVVNRCPLAGCGAGVQPEKIADAQRPVGIAVDATHVYWCDRNSNEIKRRAFTGGAVELVATANGGPQALTVENGRAWWVDDFSGQVGSHYQDGGSFDVGIGGQSGRVIKVDATRAYWGVQIDPGQRGKILSAPRNGGGQTQEVGIAGGEPLGMSLDGTTLYWTAQSPDGGAAGGGVYSCPAAGCNGAAKIVVGRQERPHGLAVDDKAIYWGTDGTVMKLAKP